MMISTKKIFTIVVGVLVLLNLSLYGQEPEPVRRSENKVILEGKIYYVHVVKRGHTLYSIAKTYNVSEKEIIIENPGASQDLIIGQVLKIPSDPSSAFKVNTKEPSGKKKTHVFKEGETIYSVSRMYGFSVEALLEQNENLDIHDIPVGFELMLPFAEPQKNELSFDEEGFIFHKVKKGESLFSISRYYGVTVGEIRKVNLELGWGGPRSGDVLRIPKPNTVLEETFQQVDIPLDSILAETDTLIEEEAYQYDELLNIDFGTKRSYKIAYLIPFNYTEMEVLDSVLKDIKSPRLRERLTEDYMIAAAKPGSVNFLEFLEGSFLAIDSLTDKGLKLDIRVFDTKMSMSRMRQIMDSTDLREMDLIIGPFYTYNLELINDFSKKYRIPVVTPFHSADSLILDNPYLIQPVASPNNEYDHNAIFIGRLYDRNLIFVHNGDSANMSEIEYYKKVLFKEIEQHTDLESVLFKEVIVAEGNTDPLVQALNSSHKNLIILPTKDEALASQVASRMYYELENYEIELFGSSYWFGFDDIEIPYIHALRLTVSHNTWYDYSNQKFLSFLKKYRGNYYKEPAFITRRGTNYGVIGYDLSLYFLSALEKYGHRFIMHLDDIQNDATISSFNFERINRRGGYSNTYLKYFYFDDLLDVHKIELPQKPPVHQNLRPAGDDPIYFRWSQPEPDTTEFMNH